MAVQRRVPNELLRRARGARSQAELAELANAEIYRQTGREGSLTAKSISDLERGWYAWPAKPTRDALCAVLGVHDAHELGFAIRRRRPNDSKLSELAVIDVAHPMPHSYWQTGGDHHQTAADLVREAATDAVEFTRRAEASDVGPQTLGHLELTIAGLASSYAFTAPSRMFDTAWSYRRQVARLLDGRQTLK